MQKANRHFCKREHFKRHFRWEVKDIYSFKWKNRFHWEILSIFFLFLATAAQRNRLLKQKLQIVDDQRAISESNDDLQLMSLKKTLNFRKLLIWLNKFLWWISTTSAIEAIACAASISNGTIDQNRIQYPPSNAQTWLKSRFPFKLSAL